MNDFFVMYKYRGLGVGKFAVNYLLDKFKGAWQVNTADKNITSVKFWTNVIGNYTNGKYELLPNDELGEGHHVFYFSNTK